MGVAGESAMSIAARMGAYDIVTTEDIYIPENEPVAFKVTSTGGDIAPCSILYGGWNPCTIGGIHGTIKLDVEWNATPRKLNAVIFSRDEYGERVFIPKGTKFIPSAQTTSADWNVLFVGTNGGWSEDNMTGANHVANGDEDKLVTLVENMVNNTPYEEKCIVIGITAGANTFDKANEMLAERFGDRFLDLKAYFLSEQAFADAGIEPTEADIKSIGESRVPPSFLDDTLHFNDAGYKLIANLVYDKLIELGFEK